MRPFSRGKLECWILLVIVISFAGCAEDPTQAIPISAPEVMEMQRAESPALILDVRSSEEFKSGHVPGAVNIPHTELESRLAEIDGSPDVAVIVYCESGGRARQAQSVLREAGFKRILDLTGHMRGWRSEGHPVAP